MKEYKTLEQQIVALWKSRGMTVKTIEVTYPAWKITVDRKRIDEKSV